MSINIGRTRAPVQSPDIDEEGRFAETRDEQVRGQGAGARPSLMESTEMRSGSHALLDWQGRPIHQGAPPQVDSVGIMEEESFSFEHGSRISKFRSQYPQYNYMSDDEVMYRIHERNYPQMSFDEFEQRFMSKYATPEPGILGTTWRGFAGAVVGVGQSLYGASQSLVGFEKGSAGEWLENAMHTMAPPPSIQASILDEPSVLANPRWWAYNVPALIPYILISVLSGGAGVKASTAAATRMLGYTRATSNGAKMIARANVTGGALGVASTHSVLEGGRTYVHAIETGQTHEEASALAANVASQNMGWLFGTNLFQMRAVLNQLGMIPTRTFTSASAKQMAERVPGQVAQRGQTLRIMGFESIQEMGQEFISNMAFDRPWYEHLPDAALLGGIGGGMFAKGMRTLDRRVDLGKYDGQSEDIAHLMREFEAQETRRSVPTVRTGDPGVAEGATLVDFFRGTEVGQMMMDQLGRPLQQVEPRRQLAPPTEPRGLLEEGQREPIIPPQFEREAETEQGRLLQEQLRRRQQTIEQTPISSIEDAMNFLNQQVQEGIITQEEANMILEAHPQRTADIDADTPGYQRMRDTYLYYRNRTDPETVAEDIASLEETITKGYSDLSAIRGFRNMKESQNMSDTEYRNILAIALSEDFEISLQVDGLMEVANDIKDQVMQDLSKKTEPPPRVRLVTQALDMPAVRTRVSQELAEKGVTVDPNLTNEQLAVLAEENNIPFLNEITEVVSEDPATKQRERQTLRDDVATRSPADALLSKYEVNKPHTARTVDRQTVERKIAELEGVPESDLGDVMRTLEEGGYDIDLHFRDDGTYSVFLWRKGALDPDIKNAVTLRKSELAGKGITANQTQFLGQMYGYHPNQINEFINEWRSRVEQRIGEDVEPSPVSPVFVRTQAVGQFEPSRHANRLNQLINQADRRAILEAFRLGHIVRVIQDYDGVDYRARDAEAGMRDAYNQLSPEDQRVLFDVAVRNRDVPEGQGWQVSPEEQAVMQQSNDAVYFAMALAEISHNPAQFLTEHAGVELTQPLRPIPPAAEGTVRTEPEAPAEPTAEPETRPAPRKLQPSREQPDIPSPGQFWYGPPATHRKSGRNNIYVVDSIEGDNVTVRKIRDWRNRAVDLPVADQTTETMPLSQFKDRMKMTDQLPGEAAGRGRSQQVIQEKARRKLQLHEDLKMREDSPLSRTDFDRLIQGDHITIPYDARIQALIDDKTLTDDFEGGGRNTDEGTVTIRLTSVEDAEHQIQRIFSQFSEDSYTAAQQGGIQGTVIDNVKRASERALQEQDVTRLADNAESIVELSEQWNRGEITTAQYLARYNELVAKELKVRRDNDPAPLAHETRDNAPMIEGTEPVFSDEWLSDFAERHSDKVSRADLDAMSGWEIQALAEAIDGTDFFASLGLPINTNILNRITKFGKDMADGMQLDEGKVDALLKDRGWDAETQRRNKTRFYQLIAMPQVLARYAPDKFGPIHQSVMDGIRIRDEAVSKLTRHNKVWNRFTREMDNVQHPVFQALVEGTLYENVHMGMRGRVWTNNDLSNRFGLNDRQITYYHEIRRIMDTTNDMRVKQAVFAGMTEVEAKEAFGLTGYFTMDRGQGDWVVTYRDDSSPRKWRKPDATRATTVRTKKSDIRPGEPEEMVGKRTLKVTDPDYAGVPYGVTFFKDYSTAKLFADQMRDEGKIPEGVFESEHFGLRERKQLDQNFYANIDPHTLLMLAEDEGIPMDSFQNNPELKKIMDAVKASNYNWARTIRRGDVPTAVNMTDNPQVIRAMNKHFVDAVEEHVDRTSRTFARAFTKTQLDSALLGVKDDAAWSGYAHKYVENAFGPDTFSDTMWADIRKAAFAYNLAWNASNAVLNLGQPLLTTLPFMLEGQWGMNTGYALNKFMDGARVAGRYLFSGEQDIPRSLVRKFPMLKSAFKQAVREGVVSPSLARQTMAADKRGTFNLFGKRWSWKQIDDVMGVLQTTTEKQNRLHSFGAMYMAAFDQGGLIDKAKGNPDMARRLAELSGLPDEVVNHINTHIEPENRVAIYDQTLGEEVVQRLYEGNLTPQERHRIAYNMGKHGSDTTQFIFGKHAIPQFIWGSGIMSSPLRTSFIFKGFLLNYVGFWANSFQKGRINYRQMIGLFGPLLAMAGLTGLPFAEDIKDALKGAGITDLDALTRNVIGNDQLADLALKGVPAFLPSNIAFDFSRRAGVGAILPRGTGRAAGSAFNMLGVGQMVGLSHDRPGAMRDVNAGIVSALADLFGGAPLAMNLNILEGIGDLRRGEYYLGFEKIVPNVARNVMRSIRYADEGAVSPGGRMRSPTDQLSTMQVIQQALGFKPLQVAKHEDMESAIRFITYDRRDAISNFNERLARAIRRDDQKSVERIMYDIMRYNNRVHPSERYSFPEQRQSIRRRLVLGTDEFADIRYAPRPLRQRVAQLQEQYKGR